MGHNGKVLKYFCTSSQAVRLIPLLPHSIILSAQRQRPTGASKTNSQSQAGVVSVRDPETHQNIILSVLFWLRNAIYRLTIYYAVRRTVCT